jgi:hypothetical protein
MLAFSANDLRNLWAVERINARHNHLAFGELPLSNLNGSLVAVASREAVSILIPLSREDTFEDCDEARVRLRRTSFDLGDGLRDYAELVCVDEPLEPIFAHVCLDVIEFTTGSDTPGKAARARFDRWRLMMATQRSPKLSQSALVGLFGELTTLKTIVASANVPSTDYWTGPDRAIHDFVYGENAIEVKSTVSRNEILIEIHGALQLDSSNLDILWLAVHQLQKSGVGATIDELLEEIVALGVDRIALYEKCSCIGYEWAESEKYLNDRFIVWNTNWYLVDHCFPKITPSSFEMGVVPAGVTRLRYSVDLTGQSPAALADEQVQAAISKFLGTGQS